MTTASRNNSELQRRPFKVAATSLQTATRGAFEKFIKQLNGSYTENLTFDTNVLISSTVVSEKYRVDLFQPYLLTSSRRPASSTFLLLPLNGS